MSKIYVKFTHDYGRTLENEHQQIKSTENIKTYTLKGIWPKGTLLGPTEFSYKEIPPNLKRGRILKVHNV